MQGGESLQGLRPPPDPHGWMREKEREGEKEKERESNGDLGRVQIKGGGLWGVGVLVLVGLLCLMDGIYLWETSKHNRSRLVVQFLHFGCVALCIFAHCCLAWLLAFWVLGWFGFGLVGDEMR